MDDSANTLRRLVMGFRATQLVFVAAKLGIADRLSEGGKNIAELATVTGAHADALYRILRALASMGIFREASERRFELTASAELLRSDAAGSLRDVAMLYGSSWLWAGYGDMLHSAQTGEPAFDDVHGRTFYRFLSENEDAATVFHRAMSAFSKAETAAILEAYDFSALGTVADVGAGHGEFIAAVLRANSHLSAIAFDQPSVIAAARERFADEGLDSRASCIGGDFFSELPSGCDLYILKSVLHNWADAAAVEILQTCRRAMASDSRVLVIERVIGPPNEPCEASLFDVNMLVVTGGLERTRAEYQILFRRAGFVQTRAIATRSPMTLLEAAPAV